MPPAQSATKTPLPKVVSDPKPAVKTPSADVKEKNFPRLHKAVEDHLNAFMEQYQTLPAKPTSHATEQAISNLDGQIRQQLKELAVLLNHRASVEPHPVVPEKKAKGKK